MTKNLEPIRSPANPRVKDWVRLHAGKHRRERGRFLIDGAYECREAMAGGVPVEELLLAENLEAGRVEEWTAPAETAGIPIRRVSDAVLGKVSVRRAPDGVIAVACRPDRTFALPEEFAGPLLVASRLEKPGNLGALIRTAYAAGGAGIVLCDPAVDFEHPQVIRASRGLVFRLPGWTATTRETIGLLGERNIPCFAADRNATADLWQVDWPERFALVLGEEHDGLPTVWRSAGAKAVSIPMTEGIDSLNVSVSGALLLYEWRRRSAAAPSRRKP